MICRIYFIIKVILKKKFLIKKTLFNLNKTNITNLYLNKFLILFKLLTMIYSISNCTMSVTKYMLCSLNVFVNIVYLPKVFSTVEYSNNWKCIDQRFPNFFSLRHPKNKK